MYKVISVKTTEQFKLNQSKLIKETSHYENIDEKEFIFINVNNVFPF